MTGAMAKPYGLLSPAPAPGPTSTVDAIVVIVFSVSRLPAATGANVEMGTGGCVLLLPLPAASENSAAVTAMDCGIRTEGLLWSKESYATLTPEKPIGITSRKRRCAIEQASKSGVRERMVRQCV